VIFKVGGIMTTEESITVKVPDAEIDKIISRGIIRVLRYAGNFVYVILDSILPVMFYCGTVFCLATSIGYMLTGDTGVLSYLKPVLIFTFLGAVWLSLESGRNGMMNRLAKWLKIDEV